MGSGEHADDSSLGHELRGVSVQHLCTGLRQAVSEVGLDDSAKIYEIEPTVIRPKGAAIICPRDGRLGSAYVDAIHGVDEAGMATHMISYTWGYTVASISSGLSEYCRSRGFSPKRTYIWICCLCINQHRVKEATAAGMTVPFTQFRQAFSSRVTGIGKVVALMAPWDRPMYLTRVWCVFEMFTALENEGIELEIVMPPSEIDSFGGSLVCGDADLEDIWRSLGNLRVEAAKASVAQDKENILRLIEEGPGFEKINEQVSGFLMDWFLKNGTRYARGLLAAGGQSPGCLIVCAKVADLLMESGLREEPARLMEDALAAAREANTLMSAEGAYLVMIRGVLKRWSADNAGAMACFEEARSIRETVGAMRTADGATLLRCISLVQRAWGRLDDAAAALEESLHIREETGSANQYQCAVLWSNIGALKLESGGLEEGFRCYKMAQQIHIDTSTTMSSDYAVLLSNMSGVLHQLGNLQEALDYAEESLKIRMRIHTDSGGWKDSLEHWIRRLRRELA